jgi:hypothetical protein
MRRNTIVIELVLVAALGVPAVFAQTRPRRVDTPTETPSPSAPQLIKPFEPDIKAADQKAADTKARLTMATSSASTQRW